MKKRGFTLIELLVVIAIIAMLLAILMPALSKVKKIAQRVVCGTNLKGLGTAQTVYANDYEDMYAVEGRSGAHPWAMNTAGWQNVNKDWSVGANLTVGASLYLLVREADVSPKSFVCGAGGQTPYEGQNTAGVDITELWDFGSQGAAPAAGAADVGVGPNHGPLGHVSYAYQMPYGVAPNYGRGRYAADGTRGASFAVMADKNHWFDPKLKAASAFTLESYADCSRVLAPYWSAPGTDKRYILAANSYPHGREGQNVLFGDGHSAYEKTSDVGVKHDNIYTIALPAVVNDERPHRQGMDGSTYGINNALQPYASTDSFLVNDDHK